MAVLDLCVCADSAVWRHYFKMRFLLLGLFPVFSSGDAQRKINGSRNVIPTKTLVIRYNSDSSYGKVFVSNSYIKFLSLCLSLLRILCSELKCVFIHDSEVL